MVTFWVSGTACGGPAASNLASLVCAAWYREARPSLNADFVLYISTSALSFACSSSHRRRSSSSREFRSSLAAW